MKPEVGYACNRIELLAVAYKRWKMAGRRKYTEAVAHNRHVDPNAPMSTGLLLSFHSHPSMTTRSIVVCN